MGKVCKTSAKKERAVLGEVGPQELEKEQVFHPSFPLAPLAPALARSGAQLLARRCPRWAGVALVLCNPPSPSKGDSV